MRVRLRMGNQKYRQKGYYERKFSHLRLQRYKNYTIYAKKMRKYLHMSKNCSNFAPAFATLAQLVEQRIRNA